VNSVYCTRCDVGYKESINRCVQCNAQLIPWDNSYVDDPPGRGSVEAGVRLLLAWHAVQLAVLFVEPVLFVFAGITQFVYAIPLAIVMVARRKPQTAGGVLVAAGATFCVNASLLGILCGGLL
jgi:hypothetical protein